MRDRFFWEFECEEWLSLFHGDCMISRRLFAVDERLEPGHHRGGGGGVVGAILLWYSMKDSFYTQSTRSKQ